MLAGERASLLDVAGGKIEELEAELSDGLEQRGAAPIGGNLTASSLAAAEVFGSISGFPLGTEDGREGK